MRYIITIIIALLSFSTNAQSEFYKKVLKRATFYTSINGGNSLSDDDTYSVSTGTLTTGIIQTPFDYSITFGIRKIARFGYENRANAFYNGTENSYGDAATIGRYKGFEFLFEGDWRRQQGINYLDQNHFLRYVSKNWVVKTEYVQDGFADVKYFETSQRARLNATKKLSFNIGIVQRISEPYGYNPLEEWLLENNQLHYTYLAIQEGYTVDVQESIYYDPIGEVCAQSSEVWTEVVIPQVLDNYVIKKRNELPLQWNHSVVIGYDYYHYDKKFWLHSWGSVMPWHIDSKNEFSYHSYNEGQWIDLGAGLVCGWKVTKSFGVFLEGKYNRYWNREWHNFSAGLNYILL
tara:strand:- start:5632 stop:6675 length:1044 start_codon:yes stop_codon:yes gene_type:complete